MITRSSYSNTIKISLLILFSLSLISACGDSSDQTIEPSKNDGLGVAPGTQAVEKEKSYEATLKGQSEVPKVETKAKGSASLTLNGDSVYVNGSFSDLSSTYVASHIHMGSEGENGDPVIPLDPEIGDDQTSGKWDASYAISDAQKEALKAGNLYVNVHSENHKSGEIRGQLSVSGM